MNCTFFFWSKREEHEFRCGCCVGPLKTLEALKNISQPHLRNTRTFATRNSATHPHLRNPQLRNSIDTIPQKIENKISEER